jgi:phage terminase large subunit-like protein
VKKTIDITVSEALASPKLFAPFFAGSSWDTWKAVIKAMFGEPLNTAELALFRAVAERDPPVSPVREMAAIAGRGGGKDSVATVIAAVMAVNYDPHRLRPGERAVVMLLAVDREQAKIAFNYIAALFREVRALAKLVRRVTDDSIELSNSVDVEVHTNSFRSVRGRSLLCVICDEVAFWRSEDSQNPDSEVVAAVQPGLGRIAGSMLILISSAHKRSGLLYDR